MNTAVLYLRVSTAAQADTAVEDSDGYSIQAQREGCRRKAVSLGLVVVDEYVDRAESARSADRPALKRMLERVRAERDVGYLIVHKVDRLARNRADDVAIALSLKTASVQLVSATENIDETPSGRLLHGIMASIAEFYSANLSAEVLKGSVQKAREGGTPFQAPVGYLNVRTLVDGRERRTIAVDPERAPLVRYAFEAYATGNYTTRQLREELIDMGLSMRPGPARPARPMSLSRFGKMLHDPYYVGIVPYRGLSYPGKHEPIISNQTFDRVQQVLAANNKAGEKNRRHPHYLKGSIFCARCESRLTVTMAKGNGGTYPYFFCLGRQRRNGCDLPFLPIEQVEASVCEYYCRKVKLADELVEPLRRGLHTDLATVARETTGERKRINAKLARLDGERLRWAEKVMAGSVPDDIGRDKQNELARQIARLRADLVDFEEAAEDVTDTLNQALDLVRDCADAYAAAAPELRRRWNQAFFERIEVDAFTVIDGLLNEPFRTLLDEKVVGHYNREAVPVAAGFDETKRQDTPNADRVLVGAGLSMSSLVEVNGLEPPTSTLRK